jgi:dipeptidyl aminopeptidase/acylaminoacyl peptidase
MFHGDRGINVGVNQSRAMDRRLKDAGKLSKLVVYEGLDHSLLDSGARIEMLDRIGTFLSAAMK